MEQKYKAHELYFFSYKSYIWYIKSINHEVVIFIDVINNMKHSGNTTTAWKQIEQENIPVGCVPPAC